MNTNTDTFVSQDVLKLADQLAKQDNRYLAIVMGLLLLIVVVFLLRYFMQQNEAQRGHLSTLQVNFADCLKEITKEQSENVKQLAVIVDRNTTALDRNSRLMDVNTEEMRELREHCAMRKLPSA